MALATVSVMNLATAFLIAGLRAEPQAGLTGSSKRLRRENQKGTESGQGSGLS